MFENIMKFLKKFNKKQEKVSTNSKDAAKERLHLVLMQDRANVSADFLELMKQEIIEVIKKYIDVDEEAIDVRLTNKENDDGTNGAPALYANIPILNIKNESRKMEMKVKEKELIENKNDENEQKPEEKDRETEENEKVEEKNEKKNIKKPEDRVTEEPKKIEKNESNSNKQDDKKQENSEKEQHENAKEKIKSKK